MRLYNVATHGDSYAFTLHVAHMRHEFRRRTFRMEIYYLYLEMFTSCVHSVTTIKLL